MREIKCAGKNTKSEFKFKKDNFENNENAARRKNAVHTNYTVLP